MPKEGSPSNEGVGLTLIANLAKLAKAWLTIVSGTGVLRILPNQDEPAVSVLPHDQYYHGTLIGMVFRQKEVSDWADLLHRAKIQARILKEGTSLGTFEA